MSAGVVATYTRVEGGRVSTAGPRVARGRRRATPGRSRSAPGPGARRPGGCRSARRPVPAGRRRRPARTPGPVWIAGPHGRDRRSSAASNEKLSRPGRAGDNSRERSARWHVAAGGAAARSAPASNRGRVEPCRGLPEGNLQATPDRKNVVRRTDTDNLVNPTFGELYAYDGLSQQTSFQRGTLNSTHTGLTGSATHSQSFAFDAVGNFTSVTTDGGTPQTRT